MSVCDGNGTNPPPGAAATAAVAPTGGPFRCTLCQCGGDDGGVGFPSRNRLFDHLRETHGHNGDRSATTATRRGRTAASLRARSGLHNMDHDAYYRLQCADGNDVLTVPDWEAALEHFRKPLPVAFRVCRSYHEDDDDDGGGDDDGPEHDDDSRDEYVRYLIHTTCGGDPGGGIGATANLTPSPFFSPRTVRVAARPPREWDDAAQQALRDAQGVGAVHRQELCSLVPPILLLMEAQDDADVVAAEAGVAGGGRGAAAPAGSMNVLDLCAAPGSKTLQLLEGLQAARLGCAKSMLVANDANRVRLLTLARRSRQVRGRRRLLLTSSDGRHFPTPRKWGGYKVKFDRVLADVPCSGDGTLRKLPEKDWKEWKVLTHMRLHRLQLRLLVRALQLAKKGGRVVYSTCSLDPIEDEAVVASAIARLGVDLYRIVPPPSVYLDRDAAEPFRYLPGATRWSVPHPKFSHERPLPYRLYDQVPDEISNRHVFPTMFPPGTRVKANGNAAVALESGGWIVGNESFGTRPGGRVGDDASNASSGARNYQTEGDVLSDVDAARLERMLPNCCRILPQHLDSGGFFCAIIERVSPAYYSICCPLQRGMDEPLSRFHGRIYHPVDSPKEIRKLIAEEKEKGEEIYFEGHPTLESAIKWLRQHGAFYEGRSSLPLAILQERTDGIADQERECDGGDGVALSTRLHNATGKVKPANRPPQYTPLFRRPHPDLIAEFCEFYGLVPGVGEASRAGVKRFPAEDIVLLGGGGATAPDVATCIDMEEEIVSNDGIVSGFRRFKFLQLSLVSKEIQSLFAGGAKIIPMEAGLVLTWVPVPESGRSSRPTDIGTFYESSETTQSEQNQPLRSVRSGRYGLLDEAAEMVGRHATRRVLDLSQGECLHLLENSILTDHPNLQNLATGGIIARFTMGNDNSSKIYLPCALRRCRTTGKATLDLLSEQRVADSWLRLVRARALESQTEYIGSR